MNREEFKALLSSVARIELLIELIMEAQFGKKEAKRVYGEVVKLIEDKLFVEENEDE